MDASHGVSIVRYAPAHLWSSCCTSASRTLLLAWQATARLVWLLHAGTRARAGLVATLHCPDLWCSKHDDLWSIPSLVRRCETPYPVAPDNESPRVLL
jgi:hypothetical protein